MRNKCGIKIWKQIRIKFGPLPITFIDRVHSFPGQQFRKSSLLYSKGVVKTIKKFWEEFNEFQLHKTLYLVIFQKDIEQRNESGGLISNSRIIPG